jgi:Cdc6-like AAA superfamily ATPase
MDEWEKSGKDLFERSKTLSAQATKVFQPRTPITTKDLFAGRWNELTQISDSVNQSGLHVVIYGERGVGKTSLANVVNATIWAIDRYGKSEEDAPYRLVVKVVANTGDTFSSVWHRLFAEVNWPNKSGDVQDVVSTKIAFSLPDQLSIDDVRRVLSQTSGGVFIIDEFDQASREVSKGMTELIKALSDLVVDCTVILVGVSETVDKLVEDHASIVRAIVQVKVERMKSDELKQILEKAEQALEIRFAQDATSLIVHLSQGLPHYTHLIGLHAVRSAAARFSLSEVQREDVFEALKKAVKQAEQSVAEKHTTAIHSAHKSALYRQVLLACALAASRYHDALGYFTPSAVVGPLGSILHKPVTIATFTNHLIEFSQEKRGLILERDGQPWGYRYRFRDPLLVPYVFMDGLESGIASDQGLVEMLGTGLS